MRQSHEEQGEGCHRVDIRCLRICCQLGLCRDVLGWYAGTPTALETSLCAHASGLGLGELGRAGVGDEARKVVVMSACQSLFGGVRVTLRRAGHRNPRGGSDLGMRIASKMWQPRRTCGLAWRPLPALLPGVCASGASSCGASGRAFVAPVLLEKGARVGPAGHKSQRPHEITPHAGGVVLVMDLTRSGRCA